MYRKEGRIARGCWLCEEIKKDCNRKLNSPLTQKIYKSHAESQRSRSIHRCRLYVPSGWRNEVFGGLTKCQAVPSEGSAVLCATRGTASVSYAASVFSASLREKKIYSLCVVAYSNVFSTYWFTRVDLVVGTCCSGKRILGPGMYGLCSKT